MQVDKNNNQPSNFVWKSEVRAYELDIQGIVNNANYLHYLDHARVKCLASKGIDWSAWHKEGLDLVLVHVEMSIQISLVAYDKFYVTSTIERSGKLKILFKQKIYRESDNKLVLDATNTVVCISTKTKRPIMPSKLESLLFSEKKT